ncbi:MAG: hypothetical protein HFH45_03790 [Bacilli bacterium]|nr:hypothetical protein [Bacilli bacterium]
MKIISNISLRNKYLDLNKNIKFIVNKHYYSFLPKQYRELNYLRNKVTKILKKENGYIVNKATGYKAKINSHTLNKILHPTVNFNTFDIKYINNLNAACKLKELFENAIYIDSLPPMKGKNKNPNELEYHHFVAPLFMNGKKYRVFITAREKVNSDILYVVSAEVLSEFMEGDFPMTISVEKLVENIRLWNYDLEEYHVYNIDNIVCDGKDDGSIYKIATEMLILH